ncbi:hypothetical protein L861_04750 [Litchfieldella anticariensis FP35 = DSM 16096]|uniref:Uncharacterized protein n=1 Tax=Litchfieldella anticariensis (strain DSM 16096 / CECT 5854 / CIP 108499 / LMG 22089 / FP35) TaxID=1121939 RepID=S2KVJ7_LITA3|nr:lipopolysaccharide assembly protein LapA domain-containing protein [Halomonas anticariensis]EPC04633.1 hypothetical protein L861_04750 [Halomonas anticariensis FP35 = DSM 16096]
MDKVYLGLKVAIIVIMVILFVQNIRVVEVNFLGWSLSLPLALLLVVVYVLGMVSGKGMMALIRRLQRQSSSR